MHAFAPRWAYIHSSYLLSEKCYSKWQGRASTGDRFPDLIPVRRAADPSPSVTSSLQSLLILRENQNFCDCLEDFSLHFCCVQGFTCQTVGCWVTGIFLSCTESKIICCFYNNNQKDRIKHPKTLLDVIILQ